MKGSIKFISIAILSLIFSLNILTVFPAIASRWRYAPIAQQPIRIEDKVIPSSSIEMGKRYYDNGQFTAAIEVLQQAAQIYQLNGDSVKQAQVLSFISLSEQKLGNYEQAEAAIKTSLSLLENLPPETRINKVWAQVLNAKGHLQLAKGNATAAVKSWQDGEVLYRKSGYEAGIIGSKINQVQALQSLGLYRQAYNILAETEQQIQAQADSRLKLVGLNNISNILRQRGNLERSQMLLEECLGVIKKLGPTKELSQQESQILLNLGNTNLALGRRAQDIKDEQNAERYNRYALNLYQQVATTTRSPITKIQAQLNQLSLLIDSGQLKKVQSLVSSISEDISKLSPSRTSIYARVNFAESLIKLNNLSKNIYHNKDIIRILNTAVTQAKSLNDSRAESYALGTIGKLYENGKDWSNAIASTQSALLIAQGVNAADIAYQWEWQIGRILRNQNTQNQNTQNQNTQNQAEAINYYSQALEHLNALRSDLVAMSPEVQFSFRDSVEPVYRQLVDLLLLSPQPSKDNLMKARNVIENLQLAELDNFFRDACAKPVAVNIDNLDVNAAVIYPIILQNRLEVIVKLPGNDNLVHFTNQNVSTSQVDEVVKKLQQLLRRRSTSTGKIKVSSKQLYDWLIKPFEAELEKGRDRDKSQIKTLVFILDGSLQNIPISILHDGEKYLIERYAVAVTPGLQLLSPKPLLREKINALIAGANNAPSFEKEKLRPLENVKLELSELSKQVSKSHKLENKNFLKEEIQKQINSTPFNVVHIATHGQFSSNPEQTFVLDWNKRINIKDWDQLLQLKDFKTETPVELLVLSACETATGDKRAALGLAGVAIRAGARSTLATLWQVNDASTAEFMIQFYKKFNNSKITKAEALRNAQLAFLKNYPDTDYNRPYHWAPFILVGNWL
ncbi:CHAT domain-containing protein [Mastigocoleus testarum]|uniref:CHAT domain-containing protein n=1 Tax=Mastigocoleus testarum BC008 TaxID=371196 RepID=A0A0V7ZC14_9CYAN|nr:CHAT domain-containing protein [Mastigocoleus testarum]KST62049.1 hypothetical protein BC008_08450 [Mastigocoleus testarum BC008]KST62617.1 hypothetical protein BC008_37910 [Mastigocoleus testarum BC008]